jgi:hypothetical protein
LHGFGGFAEAHVDSGALARLLIFASGSRMQDKTWIEKTNHTRQTPAL